MLKIIADWKEFENWEYIQLNFSDEESLINYIKSCNEARWVDYACIITPEWDELYNDAESYRWEYVSSTFSILVDNVEKYELEIPCDGGFSLYSFDKGKFLPV
jgi:hypothetical protein